MGRFASTVDLYERLRPPYPPKFFTAVAEKLKLGKQHALIDLGTGPGLLALGFAPYVGRLVGVDPEPKMLEAARGAAARAGVPFELIAGRAEDLPENIDRFDLVTIGRALHWMDERAISGLFERLVAPGGAVIVCASFSTQDGRNAWLDDYTKARRAWSEPKLWSDSRSGGRAHRELANLLQGTGFSVTETIRIEATHEVGVGDLAQRVLTFSSSSPAVVGDKVEALLADVEAKLVPFSHDGRVREVFVAAAQLVKRTG
jgi:SAM-dependent methyltransferase